MLFVEYPKCTTCMKAKKYLVSQGVEFEDRHIVEACPTKEELALWMDLSGLPIKKFFNTSGKLYKEMNLKDKVSSMTKEEAIELLSSNGMLIKRPLLVSDETVLVGFKEADYANLIK